MFRGKLKLAHAVVALHAVSLMSLGGVEPLPQAGPNDSRECGLPLPAQRLSRMTSREGVAAATARSSLTQLSDDSNNVVLASGNTHS
jgi:hypothetical protein